MNESRILIGKLENWTHLSLSSTDWPSSVAVALTTGIFVGPSTETVSVSFTFVPLTIEIFALTLFVLLTTGAIFAPEDVEVFTLLKFCTVIPAIEF